jgi:glyoxylase-like metal-dependent hydrolase (beta-lactamase superfamily II)
MTAATSSISRPSKLFTEDLDLVPTMIHAAGSTAISVHPLRRNIASLEGSGGNITVLTGEDGKLLVDAGFSVSQPRISDAIAFITQDPIRHLINSHWHTDHTDGNQWLRSAGASVTAHENTRKHLSVMTVFEVIDAKPTTAFDAKWGQFLITPYAFTALVYQGV